jgi:hypothetical protein
MVRRSQVFSTGIVVLLVACGGKTGNGDVPPTPATTTTSPSIEPPPLLRDGGASPTRRVSCKSGTTTLGTFSNERALHVVVSIEAGVVLASTRDAAGSVRVRILRDATKGLEDLATSAKSSGALAASATHVAFADDTGATAIAIADGSKKTLAQGDGSPRFLGLREKELATVRGATLTRHPLDGSQASQVCIGGTCTVAGVSAFDAHSGTMALVDTEGALYTGTDVGLRRVASDAKGPVAVGAGFVAFVVATPGAAMPSLGLFRPLEEDVELFPLPASKGTTCALNGVETRQIASDGARLAFATKESYPCAESAQALAFASRASRPDAATELSGAKGAVDVAADDTCIYALVERPQGNAIVTQLVSIDSRAR